MRSIRAVVLLMLAGFAPSAQEPPGLLFREDWKELLAATPVTQEHVANPALTLYRYGPGRTRSRRAITTSRKTTRITSGRASAE